MGRMVFCLLCAILTSSAYCADTSTPVAPRISLFSTSTDWQAVTGLNLSEYRGRFKSDSALVGRGLVLYYLDAFPCYGLGDGVRVWIDGRGRADNDLRIACVHAPTEISFAWRNMTRDAPQAPTTGILTCDVSADGRDLTIDLTHCRRGANWSDYE